jgi:hypothetical protein
MNQQPEESNFKILEQFICIAVRKIVAKEEGIELTSAVCVS